MNRIIKISLAVMFLCAPVWGEVSLRIVQPFENQRVPYVAQSFVFGSVTPATATLSINGVPVTPHRNGGFLTMIPFQEGPFQIVAVADTGTSTVTVTRNVTVAFAPTPFPPNHPKIEPLSPKTRVVLRPGDLMEVSFQAAPGGAATFRVAGHGAMIPMHEQAGSVAGIYKGIYRIQPGDAFDNEDVTYYLQRADGRKLTQRGGMQLTVQRRTVPRIIELRDRAVLLTGPWLDAGYNMFLEPGVRLEVTGEWGDFFRVVLGSMDDGWVRKSLAVELPDGSVPPRSVSRNIRIDATDFSTIIEIPLQFRHAHRVEELSHPHRLRLTLFGVVADTDRIRTRSRKSVVQEIFWSQNTADTTTFEISLKPQQGWGYDVRYVGNRLILEVRHRPILPNSRRPLQGLKVAVDAGHSKASFGTIGPWGNTEAAVNLMVAKVLRTELERRGVEVFMVQDGTKELSLQDRTDQAWAQKAHMFISLHADANEEGTDPREVEGFSLHYYHPQSRILAEEIHTVYGARSGLRDQGLWRSNLAVCRMTQMPSVLFEMAFLILPEYEEKLLQPIFQKMIAESVIAGIYNFLQKTQ